MAYFIDIFEIFGAVWGEITYPYTRGGCTVAAFQLEGSAAPRRCRRGRGQSPAGAA